MRFIGSITPIIRFLRKKGENNTVYTFQEIYYLLVSKEEEEEAIVCHCAIRKRGGGGTFTLVKSFNKHRDVETPVEISARRFAIDSLLLLIGRREGSGGSLFKLFLPCTKFETARFTLPSRSLLHSNRIWPATSQMRIG